MAAGSTATIQPVRVTRYDADLRCEVSRVVGYRARCPCGWTSTHRDNVSFARAELVQHRNEDHGGAKYVSAGDGR